MRGFQAVILTALVLFVGLSATAGQRVDSAETAIRKVVQQYLDGLRYNDIERLKLAFWADAKLFFVKRDGHLGQLTQAQWYEGFKESAGKEEKGDLRITAIDITDNAAAVKVEEDYPNAKYID